MVILWWTHVGVSSPLSLGYKEGTQTHCGKRVQDVNSLVDRDISKLTGTSSDVRSPSGRFDLMKSKKSFRDTMDCCREM